MKNLAIIIMFTACLSCKTEEEAIYDSTGVATKLPHIWQCSISGNGELTQVSLKANIVNSDENFIVGGGNNGDDRKLIKINADNGNKIWEWNDSLSSVTSSLKDPIFVGPSKYCLNNNDLFFTLNTSSYCLNTNTGKSLWKNKVYITRFDLCNNIENKYFSWGSEIAKNGDLTSNIGEYIYE